MIKFAVETKEKLSENDFVVDFREGMLKELKQRAKQVDDVVIDRDALNIGIKLYGNSKKESLLIQKANQKQMLKMYKLCVKVIKILKKAGYKKLGQFYVLNLGDKKNNNDFMLAGMLDVRFNVNIFKRVYESVGIACDYLDKENELNKMCDFRDNHCTKHRDKGIDKVTGCCPSFCKIRQDGKPCPIKNLSCKIFMCDYLINEKGYYFTANTIPILKQHLTVFERLACFGILFKSQKSTSKRLWGNRILTALYAVVMIAILLIICL